MIKCIAIDDEPLALRQLRTYIARIPFLELTGEYRNALEAARALEEHPVDLIFCDINMPDLNGIDFVRTLRSERRPMVVFTTAYSEYAVEGFKLETIIYLESMGEYVRIHTTEGKTLTTLYRLKNMEAVLPADSFMRVHRSYIVNLRRIAGYAKGRIFFSTDENDFVPIGENYRELFAAYAEKTYNTL